MIIFEKRKRTKAIKVAISYTVNLIKDKNPKVVEHFFYGAYDIAPQHLVIWYLFETNEDLEIAKANGLTDEIIQNTKTVMINNGYPKQAFEKTEFPLPKVSFANGTEEQKRAILESMQYRMASISFTTKQDINEKANGDYRLYFQ